MKNLKGQISIHRFSGSRSGISIEIIDETSRITFLSVKMDAEAFGNVVTGLSMQPCTFDLSTKNVNKVHEHKTEVVHFESKDYKKDEVAAKKALEPFEVDGWVGNPRDLFNNHRWVKGSTSDYTVTFHRYVNKPDDANASFTK